MGSVSSSSTATISATTGMPMSHVGGIDADEVAHEPGPLLELDHGDGQRVVEPAHLGVMDDDVAVDRAAPDWRSTVSHSKDPHDAHAGRGRVAQHAARRATLDEQRAARRAPSKKKALSWVMAGRGRRAASASGRGAWGRNRRMRNRMVATRSPCWSVNSSRVVTKWPSPSPVCFSGETESMTEDTVSRSPSTMGRAYSWSQFVATTEVNPAALKTSKISSWVRQLARRVARRPSKLPPGWER